MGFNKLDSDLKELLLSIIKGSKLRPTTTVIQKIRIALPKQDRDAFDRRIEQLCKFKYLIKKHSTYNGTKTIKYSISYEGENYLILEKENELSYLNNNNGVNNRGLKKILDNIDEVKKCFHLEGGNGMPEFNVLSGDNFESWRSSIQFEMQRLNQDQFVLEILKLTNAFNGWQDEKIFAELCSKLKVLYENSDIYYGLLESKGDEVLDKKKVFVVHGRNEKIRKSMFDFLRSIGLRPIEWDEAKMMTGKPTPYVGEILDVVFSNAQTVIVLITPDDEAKLKDEFVQASDKDYEKHLTPQARPNVIYEAGMAMGRCPNRTILIEFGDNLRPYSDIGGLNVIRMTDSTAKRSSLIAVIKTAGADIEDLTGKTDWMHTGDFNI